MDILSDVVDKMDETNSYGAEAIKVLEGLEGVRKRPAMYIGSTGKDGLHHLVYEVVDNSVDEALAGYCTKIKVFINKDGSVTVEDDGRGIPVEINQQFKLPAVQLALTKLHAGGKFDKKSYAVSGGLHGVGVSCVNALSKKLIVEIKRGGKIYSQEYSRGNAKTKLTVVGRVNSGTGTKITFWPDEEIFSVLDFDGKVLETRFREISFLNAGLKIELNDEIKGKKQEFFSSGGLMEFVKWINGSKEVLHKPVYFKRQVNGTIVDVAVQYNTGYRENIFGFVNTINTVEGGTHVSGFKTALTRVINDYSKKKNLLKNGSLMGDDVREGLTAVISIKIGEPQFEGQTKTKLGNSEIKGIVDSIVSSALGEFFEENPAVAKKIVSKALDSAKARLAAKKAKELVRRKNAFSLGGLPGKLSDCSNKKSDNTELYLVEGESAGGSSRQARDKNYQAILPLRGKILNVEKSNPARALSSEEITNMITAIGTGVGDQFDLKKLRYSKVVIMSVDGEETTFIRNSSGNIQFVRIGEFIDKCKNNQINFNDYEVLCFGIKNNKTQFKKIKSVISHPIKESMFKIRTSYGRSVSVTSSHSIFVLEKNKIKLKKGNEIKKGDFIVAPKNLPLYGECEKESIDVLELLMKNVGDIKDKIYVRGKSVEELLKRKIIDKHGKNHKLTEERVFIPKEIRNVLIKRRKLKKFSQLYICNKIGIKKPCVYYDWEKGKRKPLLSNFRKYLALLDFREEEILPYIKIESSILENLWDNFYRNSGRNKVKDYIEFSKLSFEDIKELGDVKICPRHYKDKGINRYIRVDNNLIKLIGFWLAEGSCSERNGIRLSIGNNNINLVNELEGCFYNVFGISPKLSKTVRRCYELKLVNRIASLVWKSFFGFIEFRSNNKKFPDIIFNISQDMQLDFLRMYFLGDGTVSKSNISFTTTSRDMASQLSYLLSSFGVVSSINEKEPIENEKIKSRHVAYIVSVNSREDIIRLKKVWEIHKNAKHLEKKINSKFKSINKRYKKISNDLMALEVMLVKEVKSSSNLVYDFSVEGDENFIAGFGGLCCHNTDADVDGEHIKTLLLTFFFRFMPDLVKEGKVYVAMPPLFRIRKKKDYYVYSEEELKKMCEKLGASNITRFKGLGEMNLTQLWETTMNPKTRKIKRIFIEDAVEADRTFSMLMGDDVQARKEFIQENAKEAMLDV